MLAHARVCSGIGDSVSSHNASGLDLMDVCAYTHTCVCAEMGFIFEDGLLSRTGFSQMTAMAPTGHLAYTGRKGLCEEQCGTMCCSDWVLLTCLTVLENKAISISICWAYSPGG